MTEDLWAELADLGLNPPRAALELYVEELYRWNQSIRLLGPRDRPGIRLQVVDALLPFAYLPARFPLVDIGSGAGLPGIALALLHPHAEIVCLEPRLKRFAFLRHICRTLRLNHVEVIGERTERALGERPALAHWAGTVTARAVADVASLLDAARPFLAPEGRVILPRGGDDSAAAPGGWECTQALTYRAPKPLGSRKVLEFRPA